MKKELISSLYERWKQYRKTMPKTSEIDAFIHLIIEEDARKKLSDIARALSEESIVREVHIVTGECDLILKVRAKDFDELSNFITKKLREYAWVKKTTTLLVLESI
ncbi:MAG: Lrp/AsnC ligand binding domain-containing protein [Candidatus Parvarchaeota archaeon]|nr:Lrp/AsnC ligand binding domain-containing protein [Candidatus Jingweiarchaeum tengchongense]MCW1298670.1 Lrp/AsnC ligand binding domain-containing protein [Candidatus Jingweiarchaeum tengchongense]MCW1300512.1 Lrp/AsnC ligand binding domain-containing protein [Candidatus Jingweiarchaeum tengchongense]MCW1304673.1 Lrp/AsnC ligand binding domain-containing protein [Candidatus Jingweiarchaeum tengchongense]MCW1305862.1 Lrp/AsnC ligand binding domain-containing protein [Candidatus Jingweiarchaeu